MPDTGLFVLLGIWILSIMAAYYFLREPLSWIVSLVVSMIILAIGTGAFERSRKDKPPPTMKEWDEQWKNRDTSNIE